ncbi:MAG TPA: hypothetical protein VLY04_19110 [Bryobacteraceae bacterium]|nr:hypothetical protein [Bryobacteraceae bacterium]
MENVSWRCGLFCVAAVCSLAACESLGRGYWLSKYDGDIRRANLSLQTAHDNRQRAAAYTRRGSAYAEKARYSRSLKLISAAEYGRLFDLAVQDHDRAVQLAPGNAEAYFSRGETYYGRAASVAQDDMEPKSKAQDWYHLAIADFTHAIQCNGRHSQAFDMRGLIYEQAGDYDQAINDFTEEAGLSPKIGRLRLADAHCLRAGVYQGRKEYDLAIADYEKAIEFGVPSDSCDCDPYGPLAWVYFDGTHQYDKSWEVVHRAQAARRWIPPELLGGLKRASGRDR